MTGMMKADNRWYFALLIVAALCGNVVGLLVGYSLFSIIGAVVGAILGGVLAIVAMVTIEGRLTGKHALSLILMAFAPIMVANYLLATNAISTFPGLETKNSYVTSQQFDADRAAQEALGWAIEANVTDGELILSITDANGQPVEVASLDATLGRATHVAEDQTPAFVWRNGAYVAPVDLGDGNWNLRMKAVAEDGTEFRQRVVIHKR